jgi:hypothetical protein
MNRVTVLSLAFLAFALAVSAWLLTRTPSVPVEAAAPAGLDPRAGMTFAEWSARSDAVLLADIDPGEGKSTVPRRFMTLLVKADLSGSVNVTDGKPFSWAVADRTASAQALTELGFRVSTDGRAYVPPDEPLWSDPVVSVDGGTEQTVTLRAKGSSSAPVTFVRHRGEARTAVYWGRRAIGFPSSDGRFVYVTPDAVVIRAPHPT